MSNHIFKAVVAGVLLLSSTSAFAADLTPQPVSQVNVTQLADGVRASKLVGATVANDANQNIGKIDDLLVGRSDRVLYAVISVGGFLGVGDKLVAVPYQSLQLGSDKLVLPGGSKEQLKSLPEFKYAG